jgi:hypothetical protein
MKNILEVRLQSKAWDDLRLICELEGNLVVKNYDRTGRKECLIKRSFAFIGRDPGIGRRDTKHIIWALRPEADKIYAAVEVDVDEIAV